MLTAWMRFKYPNLVDGGLAGSAPIYYTEGLVPRTAFFAKVTEVNSITCACVLCVEGGSAVRNSLVPRPSQLFNVAREKQEGLIYKNHVCKIKHYIIS